MRRRDRGKEAERRERRQHLLGATISNTCRLVVACSRTPANRVEEQDGPLLSCRSSLDSQLEQEERTSATRARMKMLPLLRRTLAHTYVRIDEREEIDLLERERNVERLGTRAYAREKNFLSSWLCRRLRARILDSLARLRWYLLEATFVSSSMVAVEPKRKGGQTSGSFFLFLGELVAPLSVSPLPALFSLSIFFNRTRYIYLVSDVISPI